MKTHNNDIYIDKLISAYFSKGLQEDELVELRSWIAESEANKLYFGECRENYLASIGKEYSEIYDSNRAFDRFVARTQPSVRRKNNYFLYKYASIASVILLAIVGSIAVFTNGQDIRSMATNRIYVEAPLGSNSKITLPDGTVVHLNAGSKIVYTQSYGLKDRQVDLLGEAYFEVTKNTKMPFVVSTTEMDVQVLGTTFNFCSYEADTIVKVDLLEGKVLLVNHLNEGEEKYLLPAEGIILSKTTGEMTHYKANAGAVAQWKDGRLYFDEERLSGIVKKLERAYNVQIIIADDSLRNYRFYGSFARNEHTIDDILDFLASTEKLTYHKQGKNIMLTLKKKEKRMEIVQAD